MKLCKVFSIKLENETYLFYNEIAMLLNRPIEAILSDTLYKCAEIIAREAGEDKEDSRRHSDFSQSK